MVAAAAVMRLARHALVGLSVAALAACAPTVGEMNARPDRYYQQTITLTACVARRQDLSDGVLLELADPAGARILVRADAPVEVEAGDWVKVRGIFVPEARAGGATLYDVVVAEKIGHTHAPRLMHLM